MTLIQRFGSALNLNVHLHMLFLDGVYESRDPAGVFHRVRAPSAKQLQTLLARISRRVGRYLESSGWLTREEQSSFLRLDDGDPGAWCMDRLRAHSITYRVASDRTDSPTPRDASAARAAGCRALAGGIVPRVK